jgi:GTP-binding protein Era
MCVVNKVDRIKHEAVIPQLTAAQALGPFEEIVPISARGGDGVDTLRDLIVARMPEGPSLYPDDDVTDQSTEQRLAELVREQALQVTREEVPHSIAVTIEEVEREGDLTRVHANLIVERDSQKGIVIGKGGATLKAIGSAARVEMEQLLGTRVHLDLRVKVIKEWQRDTKALDRLGF